LRTAEPYNFAAVSFTPAELAAAITGRMPGFAIDYAPDERQAIADSWPASIDDTPAREEWGWRHRYGTPELVEAMLAGVRERADVPLT
jgi:nucleoside-diphosphate-sugar epimerase